jgi:hypothetical protein
MIRRSIEPGTIVFHEVYGFGKFIKWISETEPEINFSEGTYIMHRKDLTEVEEWERYKNPK